MKHFITKNYRVIAVTLLTALSFLLGVLFIGQKDFSLDEVATALIVRNWSTMIHMLTYTEGNMWLYYFLLYFWQIFGTNEFVLRSLSVIFGSATIPVIYLLGKKLFNTKVALLATLLTSINVFLISNEQNTRAYTLLLLLTTLSSYFFTKYVISFLETKKAPKKYLFLTIVFNILAIYTHLYSILVIASQFVALLITFQKKLLKSLYYFIPFLFVFMLPLAFLPSLHSGQINWIPVPGIRNLIGTFIILSDDFPPVAALYLLLFGGFFAVLWKKRNKIRLLGSSYWNLKYLFVWLLLPVVVSFLFSLFVKPLYISLYFFICLVPFTLIISYIITQIKKTWLQNLLIALLIALSAIRLYGFYSGNQQLQLVISNNNEDWKGVANFLANDTQSNDAILFFPPFVQENVDYYLQRNDKNFDKKREINLQPDIFAGTSGLEKFDKQQLLEIPYHYQRLWYIYGTYTDSALSDQQNLITAMLTKNYLVQREVKFYGITAYLYIKK